MWKEKRKDKEINGETLVGQHMIFHRSNYYSIMFCCVGILNLKDSKVVFYNELSYIRKLGCFSFMMFVSKLKWTLIIINLEIFSKM